MPGLGLKRGLSEDLVVAPYATALAAMVDPRPRCGTSPGCAASGARGRVRLPRGARLHAAPAARRRDRSRSCRATWPTTRGWRSSRSATSLNDRAMVERFHADPIVQATELLLQERMPRDVLVARPRAEEVKSAADVRDLVPPVLRRFTSPHDAIPRTHLLSNGRYAVMVTAAGSGYSRWRDLAVTRWREDVTRDDVGQLPLPARHATAARSGRPATSRAAPRPTATRSTYSEDRAEFRRRDGVDRDHARRSWSRPRTTPRSAACRSPTSASQAARDRADVLRRDRAGAAGGRRRPPGVLRTCSSRPSSCPSSARSSRPAGRARADERPVWAAHVAAVEDGRGGVVQYETDRARFLGRGRGRAVAGRR